MQLYVSCMEGMYHFGMSVMMYIHASLSLWAVLFCNSVEQFFLFINVYIITFIQGTLHIHMCSLVWNLVHFKFSKAALSFNGTLFQHLVDPSHG